MAPDSSDYVKVHCACGAALKLSPKAIGKKIKCPKCESVFVAEEEESPFSLAPLDTYDEELLPKPEPPKPVKQSPPQPPPSESNKPSAPCPLCGKPIVVGSVMCVACGYDTRTGRRVGTTKISVSAAKRLAKGAGTFLLGCVLSGVGALVGAAIWLGIGVATNREVGYIAWGLGLLAGAGMALGYRQYNTRAGLTAACIALGGILMGKAALFIYFVYVYTTGDTQDVKLLRGHLIQRYANEELNKRNVWDPKEREKEAPPIVADVSKRVARMKDSEVEKLAQEFRDEEAAQEEQFTDVGFLRSRIAWHEAEREAEAKGMKWNDPQRDKLAEKNERKLRLLPESQLKVREKELDEWQKEGRFADGKYVHDRLVYEFIEEDLRAEPPAELEEVKDLGIEEWDVPDKVWKEHYQIALDDVKELNSQERVEKLKEMEAKRADDEIRDRLTYHRSELKANCDGLSRYDWEARSALSEQQRKELDSLTHEQLADESAKLDEWQKDGKDKDTVYLRAQLIYAYVDLEVEAKREAIPEDAENPYWTPNKEEWAKLHADAVAKVEAVPAEQYSQKLRDAEAQQEQVFEKRMESTQREEAKRLAGTFAGHFFKSMIRPLDILFIILALSSAYRVGSHGFSKNQS